MKRLYVFVFSRIVAAVLIFFAIAYYSKLHEKGELERATPRLLRVIFLYRVCQYIILLSLLAIAILILQHELKPHFLNK